MDGIRKWRVPKTDLMVLSCEYQPGYGAFRGPRRFRRLFEGRFSFLTRCRGVVGPTHLVVTNDRDLLRYLEPM